MTIEPNARVAGWANYPVISAELATPEDVAELAGHVRDTGRLIARGNGKSYGDAALAPHIASTLALRRIRKFDVETGVIDCEAGVLLADLLPLIVPAGWFFHVTPGIKAITVGGAIACDVHGKNHTTAGCFSNWLISFELMKGDGTIVVCSREQNRELFWQSCGGMGWTGVIVSARFRLMRIQSAHMRQTTVRADDLETLWRAFDDHREWPYAAAWIDGLSEKGRGAAFFAVHETEPAPLEMPAKAVKNIPFFAPNFTLNRLSIRLHNELMWRRTRPGEKRVSFDEYFYPLDQLSNWNRLYGRRGFVQYQFCLPEKAALEGLPRMLSIIRRSGEAPFLSVLKRHGDPAPEAVHSFPIKGWSLALDFPRTATIFRLVQALDDELRRCGGKIYLAKDACSAPDLGGLHPGLFGEEKFSSLLKERLLK